MKKYIFTDTDTDKMQCLAIDLIYRMFNYEYRTNAETNMIIVITTELFSDVIKYLAKQFKIDDFKVVEID